MFDQEYSIYNVKKISCENFDGTHYATVRNIQKGNFKNATGTIWAEGENKTKLTGFNTEESAQFTATSGMVSDGGFRINGCGVKVLTSTTGYKVEEVILLDSATTAVLTHKATGTVGSEIGYIYACDKYGNIDPDKKYAQDTAASATKCAYAAATKTITLPTSIFAVGEYILVKYFPTFSEIKEVTRTVGAEPFQGVIRVFVIAKKLNDNTLYKGQIYIPDGRFDANYDIAVGDAVSVQDFVIDTMNSDGEGDFWKLLIVDEKDIVDA